MKKILSYLLIFTIACTGSAQQPQSVTVRMRLDHNRIIIPVSVYLPNGKMKEVNAWVDNGTSTMSITARLAKELEITTSHVGRDSVVAKPAILIGRMRVKTDDLHEPIELESSPTVGSGLEADINLPSTILHNYDLVIDYPARQFTMATPGIVHFRGKRVKAFFNPHYYLIQLPAQVDNSRFNLALDVGTPVSFISADLISLWSRAHASWPSMIGAVGIANLWGLDDEPDWTLLRVANLAYAGITFTDQIVVSFPRDRLAFFSDRAGISTAGLMGAASLLNERIGIDYKNGLVYFERLGSAAGPDMNLVGLILRPESDGRFLILGVASDRGASSVPGVSKGDVLVKVNGHAVTGLTMGAVWALLHGNPGADFTLIIERSGNQMTIHTLAHNFLR
jgi:hypothetical protein